jgi:hypothetical protein
MASASLASLQQATNRIRTDDPSLTRRLLYQLSYGGGKSALLIVGDHLLRCHSEPKDYTRMKRHRQDIRVSSQRKSLL